MSQKEINNNYPAASEFTEGNIAHDHATNKSARSLDIDMSEKYDDSPPPKKVRSSFELPNLPIPTWPSTIFNSNVHLLHPQRKEHRDKIFYDVTLPLTNIPISGDETTLASDVNVSDRYITRTDDVIDQFERIHASLEERRANQRIMQQITTADEKVDKILSDWHALNELTEQPTIISSELNLEEEWDKIVRSYYVEAEIIETEHGVNVEHGLSNCKCVKDECSWRYKANDILARLEKETHDIYTTVANYSYPDLVDHAHGHYCFGEIFNMQPSDV